MISVQIYSIPSHSFPLKHINNQTSDKLKLCHKAQKKKKKICASLLGPVTLEISKPAAD